MFRHKKTRPLLPKPLDRWYKDTEYPYVASLNENFSTEQKDIFDSEENFKLPLDGEAIIKYSKNKKLYEEYDSSWDGKQFLHHGKMLRTNKYWTAVNAYIEFKTKDSSK